MENHIWKKIGRQLDNEWRNLGDNWRPHLGERWKTTKQQKDSLSLSLSPSPSDLPARAVQRARWKHAHVALLQQPDWETTSRKPHLGDNWETTSGRQVEDNWETTSVRQLGDNWVTSGRQFQNTWKRANFGFGNFNVRFGNLRAHRFGNSWPPRIRKLQRQIR